jgi:hypothetical protein
MQKVVGSSPIIRLKPPPGPAYGSWRYGEHRLLGQLREEARQRLHEVPRWAYPFTLRAPEIEPNVERREASGEAASLRVFGALLEVAAVFELGLFSSKSPVNLRFSFRTRIVISEARMVDTVPHLDKTARVT